jgi:uncharacterized membrane protein
MWLIALGVYIGRYLRYNSWDVISNPFELLAAMFRMALHPIEYKSAWGMVVLFSFFLSLMYNSFKKLGHAIC